MIFLFHIPLQNCLYVMRPHQAGVVNSYISAIHDVKCLNNVEIIIDVV